MSVQELVIVGINPLDRGRIDRPANKRLTQALDPDSGKKTDAMILQNTEKMIDEAGCLPPLIAITTGQTATDVRPFNLGNDLIEMIGRRVGQSRKKSAFQMQEVLGNGLKARGVDNQSAQNENWLVVTIWRWCRRK